jgi:hypothetical protein
MKTIVFELNEVPWRVMDWFCDKHPKSAFAQIRDGGRHFETISEDSGHLHPWVTWSSVHRGVENDRHDIAHLGQDLADVNSAYPTVWELLRRSGRKIGVGGSLHSYPTPKDATNISFYIPDTFAAGPETIPAGLSSFQNLSLRLTKENGRNVKGGADGKTAIELLRSIPKIGLTAGTISEVASQLVRERTDKTKLNRRRAMQSALYFDAFMRQLRSSKPDFSTFFTNHVAAAMHRYWAATFPDDYDRFDLPESWLDNYAHEIDWAMSLADGFAERLIAFCRRNSEFRIIVCSSMGQSATTAKLRAGIYQIKNLDKLFASFGIERNEYKQVLAMAPDISAHLQTDHAVGRVRTIMPALVKALGGEWDIDDKGMLHAHVAFEDTPETPLADVMIGNRQYAITDIGFEFVADQDRVAVTAYHTPEGILMTWKPSDTADNNWIRSSVSSLDVAPAILRDHGVPLPDYMRQSVLSLA